ERPKWILPRYESDVSASRKELDLYPRIAAGDASNLLEDIAREKRVVGSAEQKRRDTDSREKSNRARTCVVVICVGKSMDRSCDDVIKLEQCTCRADALTWGEARIPLQLRERLLSKRLEEVSLIHTRRPAVDMARSSSQVERHRHSGRTDHSAIKRLARLTEPLEQHVSAKGNARKQERRLGISCQQPLSDRVDVARIAGMIESGATIGLATAT